MGKRYSVCGGTRPPIHVFRAQRFALLLVSFLVPFAHAGTLTVGAGTVVVVADVGATDAHVATRATLIGEVCTVSDGGLSSVGDGWWKGSLACADGEQYSFGSVSVSVPGTQASARSIVPRELARQLGSTIQLPQATAGVASPGGPSFTEPRGGSTAAPSEGLRRSILPGEPVTLLALHPEDAYYGDRGEVLGRQCWATDSMSQNDPGWFGGPMSCWDGNTYYFYKVALIVDPTHPAVNLEEGGFEGGNVRGLLGSLEVGDVIEDGRRVKITEISPDDPLFADRMKVIGKTCVVTGDLREQEPGGRWFGGGLTCKRDYFYFYKIRVDPR